MSNSFNEKFAHLPVLVGAVGQVPSHNERHLLLAQLNLGKTVGVALVASLNHKRGIFADLECACAQDACAFVLGHEFGSDALIVRDSLDTTATHHGVISVLLLVLVNNVDFTVVAHLREVVLATV